MGIRIMQKWKLGAVAAAGAVVLIAGVYAYQRGTMSMEAATAATNPAMMAMPVPVAKIVRKTIPIYLEYSARTEAIRNVALQAKIAGYVQSQNVADGADVKEGDLLYTIDPRDYQAALDAAKAQLLRDTAALDYARGNVERGTSLANNGYLDKNTFEQRTSALRQAEAAISIAQAAVRSAEINLSYTEIRAPFTGRLGRNQASVGTLITTGSATLNTLVQLDPIYVTFNPSETDLAAIDKARGKGPLKAEVYLPGEDKARASGEVTFVDNTVDRSTGTIVARATIANADHSLLPGQYVRVRLAIREQPNALVVPQAALGSNQLGKYVYVVGKDNKVDMRLVSLGPTDGNLVVIDKGISEGDQVISGNLQKIGPGSLVQPLPH
jgi:multidrug efflux system membrane fusion protein